MSPEQGVMLKQKGTAWQFQEPESWVLFWGGSIGTAVSIPLCPLPSSSKDAPHLCKPSCYFPSSS